MAGFGETVELERGLLNLLCSTSMVCRLHIHNVRDEFFTSKSRKFIFALISEQYKQGHSLVTKKIFDYELGVRVDASEAPLMAGEWNLIEKAVVLESAEALISKMSEARTARDLVKLGDSVESLLSQGDVTGALQELKSQAMMMGTVQEDRPLAELSDYKRREELIRDKQKFPDKYLGLQTGWDTFDRQTGGLFAGELTLLAAVTGVGKSTIVRQLLANIVHLNPGKNVLHIANEEYLEQVEHKYDACVTGIPYLDFKRGTISDEDMESWRNKMRNWSVGGIFVKEVPAFTDVTLVEQAYRELEMKGIKIDIIVIDHLPHVKPIQQSWGENDEKAKAAADCKELARWLKIPVVVPTQAATEVAKKQDKGQRGGKMDVYGSKAVVHVANTFMMITTQGKDETQTSRQEWQRDVYWLCDIVKNRDGAPFYFRTKHIVACGQVVEVTEDEASQISAEARSSSSITDVLSETEDKARKELEESGVTASCDSVLDEFADDADQKPEVQVEELEEVVMPSFKGLAGRV